MATKRKGKGPSGKPVQYPVCNICGVQQQIDLRRLPMAGRKVFCGDCDRSNPDVVATASPIGSTVIRIRRTYP